MHISPWGIKMGIGLKNTRRVVGSFIRKTGSTDGFTLIELLISVAIVGILASIALFTYSELRDQVKITRCKAEIRGIEKYIIAYASEKGTYPPNLIDFGIETLKDPWGNTYVYSPIPTRTSVDFLNTDFDIYSKGPTGNSTDDSDDSIQVGNGTDDIVRGSDGSFVGTAEEYML